MRQVRRNPDGRTLPADVRGDRSQPHVCPPLFSVVTSSHDDYFLAFRQLRLSGFILERAARKWSPKRCRLASCVLEHGVDAAPWSASGSTAEGVVARSREATSPIRLLRGTLAADYRALFGELPSETRRALGELLPRRALSRVVPLSPKGFRRSVGVEVAMAGQRSTPAADPSGQRRGGTEDARTV